MIKVVYCALSIYKFQIYNKLYLTFSPFGYKIDKNEAVFFGAVEKGKRQCIMKRDGSLYAIKLTKEA